MQNIYKKYSICFLALCIFACKRVVDIDLKNAIPKIVIEGNITDESGPYTVTISKTINYANDNIFPPVVGAVVTVKDNTANTTNVLTETSPGTYKTATIQGVQGHNYTLTVVAEGEQYTVTSTMPAKILLDSVTFLKITAFGNTTINAVPNFQDPVGTPNYFKFQQTINDRKLKQFFAFDDRLSDGRYIARQLFNDSAYFNAGDTLLLEMQCVDKNVFSYFNQLEQIISDGQSSTPANPTSNISNNALGYFSAHTVQRKKVAVKF